MFRSILLSRRFVILQREHQRVSYCRSRANPITQLAFTFSQWIHVCRILPEPGMHVDDFAANLSFFFSNGMDPEYSVIGRVARRIWSKAMKHKYKANSRSQMLKYHIQTSGRSLYAQEIDLTISAQHCRPCTPSMIIAIVSTQTRTTKLLPHQQKKVCAAPWPFSLLLTVNLAPHENENPNQGAFLVEN